MTAKKPALFASLLISVLAACADEPPPNVPSGAPTSSGTAATPATPATPAAPVTPAAPAIPASPATPATPSAPAGKTTSACARAGGHCVSNTSPTMEACGKAAKDSDDCGTDSFCCVTGKAP